MIRDYILVIGVAVLLVGIATIGIIGAYRSPQTQQETKPYSINDADRPTIKLAETAFSFGIMSVKDTKTHDITITNTGSKPLALQHFSTSCDCTFARMTIDGKQSPEFSMHGMSMWQGIIQPGKTGTLTAIYEPSRMPVQGHVERSILFETNDPANPRVEVKFTAQVN